MLARGDRRPRHAGVGGRRGQVQDDLDGRIGEQRVDRHGREAALGRERRGSIGIEVRAGGEVDHRKPVAAAQVQVGDVAAADDPDARPGEPRHARDPRPSPLLVR